VGRGLRIEYPQGGCSDWFLIDCVELGRVAESFMSGFVFVFMSSAGCGVSCMLYGVHSVGFSSHAGNER
jgi:hypothetical protein